MMLTVPSSNARLRGTTNKQSGGKSPVTPTSDDGRLNSPGGLSQRSKSSSNLSNKLPPLPATPGLSQSISMDSTGDEVLNSYRLPQPLPLWLNPAYAKHIVKGNFMTLSSRPKTVDQGEWMAHQGIYQCTSSLHLSSLTPLDSGRALPQFVELCPRRVYQGAQRHFHLQRQNMPPHVCWTVRRLRPATRDHPGC
jgi:hypothetical protein